MRLRRSSASTEPPRVASGFSRTAATGSWLPAKAGSYRARAGSYGGKAGSYAGPVCALILLTVSAPAFGQGTDAGQQSYVTRCARCHGTDGNGGETGPAITARVP